MRIPARMMPHGGKLTYEVLEGLTGKGQKFGDAVTPGRAMIQESRRLVKGAASEEVSTAQVWLDPEHHVPIGSKMTIWLGTPRQRTTTVLGYDYYEAGPGLPEHYEYLLK